MKSGFVQNLALGIATAVAIAGSGAVISAGNTNAVQDQRIQSLEQTVQKMEKLSDALSITNTNVAVLNAKLERENAHGKSD